MYEFGIVPLEVVKANEGKPIPYGIWDTYSKKYNWKLDIQFSDEAKVKEVWYFFYNGEKYDLFGTSLIEQYPDMIPDHLKWNIGGDKPVPREIKFSWLLGNRYVGKVKFDEKKIYAAFEEFFKDNPDGEATLIIRINMLKTYADVRLVSGDKEVWIKDNEIEVTKTKLTY